MSLSITEFILAMVGSLLAGAINTLAGNGSVITLSILTDLAGLPANIANGTNRVGVLLQTAGSGAGFAKNNAIEISKSWQTIVLTIIGALAGVYCAVIISNVAFLAIFKYLMIVMLIIVLIKPEKWLAQNNQKAEISYWVIIPLYLLLGFYGGFIQMGMGIFFLAVLVLISKYSIMEANALKTLVIFIYTCVVLTIFAWKGLVNWEAGLIMAAGQTIGGYLTASYASRIPNINIWAYRLLIVIIVYAILSQFGILKFIFL